MRFETVERGKRRIYRIRKAVTTAGRDLACDISLASVSVSRRHVEFSQEGPLLRFRDLGSRNGVRLNGQGVREGVLSDGDRLQVGEVVLAFHAGESQEAQGAAAESEARSPTGEEMAPTPLDLSVSQAVPSPAEPAPEPAVPPSSPSRAKVPAFLRSRKVLAAIAVSGLAVAAAVAARPFLKREPPPRPGFTSQDYAEEVRRALASFRRYEAARLEGSPSCVEALAEAQRILQNARARMPGQELAPRIERALSFQEKLGSDYAAFPHDDAWKAWEEVKKVRGIEPEVEILATARQKWMDAENEALRILMQAQGLSAEGKRDEALGMLLKIPAGSLSRRGGDGMESRLRADGFSEWRAKAEAAESRGDWDKALSALERSAAYAASEGQKADLAALRSRVEASRSEEALYAEARRAFEQGRMDRAKELLVRFQPASRFSESVQSMLSEIQRQEALAGLRSLFARGEGGKALVEMGNLPEGSADPAVLLAMKTLVERVLAAAERAEREERTGRMLEATQAWREVSSALSDPEHKTNAYRVRSEAFLSKWTPDGIAAHYLQEANRRVGKGDFVGARESYELARKADPKGEQGVVAEIKRIILPVARRLQTEAFGLKAKGNLDLARKALKEALAMLRPGDSNYEGIHKDLLALPGAEGK